MDRELAMEVVRVTEVAALASAYWMGRGRKNEADEAATNAMRKMFDTVSINGTVVIGEGEMDEAPMLYIGKRWERLLPRGGRGSRSPGGNKYSRKRSSKRNGCSRHRR